MEMFQNNWFDKRCISMAYIPTWIIFSCIWCMQREIVPNLKVAPLLQCHYQCCAGRKYTLTLHNTVKWQEEGQIKVLLQSKQSISLFFFPISSHSATVRPVKLGLATVEWEKKASWGCCYLMITLDSVYPSTDVPFWFIETDHLICALSALSPSRAEFSSHSTMNERFIIIVCIHNIILVQPE